ncbi:unnamed protein product [Blepharisma stoltei]|uniref:Serine aminopeptidase S33 domain-containing protein n=1 Tax=Blepharisma stoltei TaxID=1481888 RepID=A0AAU9JFA2_9CILI|nr:unnamed protein product [Blepharisma stoltei]
MKTIANLLIRPPRTNYSTIELGSKRLEIFGQDFIRQDIQIKNSRGLNLACSHFIPKNSNLSIPCVIYCHGNSGSRMDCLDSLAYILPNGISLFCFDFSGAGLSEGDFLSMGYFEQDDIRAVIEYLSRSHITRIGLWGRSMGAVACLLYASSDQSIDFVVAESPFSSLDELCTDLVKNYAKLPAFLSNLIVRGLRKVVLKEGNFDICQVNVMNVIEKIKSKIFLLHSPEDEMVPIKHSYNILEKGNSVSLMEITGDHNKPRDMETLESISTYIIDTFDERSFEEDISEEAVPCLPSLPKPVRSTHCRKKTDICVGNYIPENKFRQALKELNPNI